MQRHSVVVSIDARSDPGRVRRFLADDGFDVVGEAATAEELLDTVAASHPEFVVADARVLAGSLDELRRRAPDARIVVVTGPPSWGRPAVSGDAYVDRGAGLVTLLESLRALAGPDREASADARIAAAGLAAVGPAALPVAPEPRDLTRLDAGVAVSGVAGITVLAVLALLVLGRVWRDSAVAPSLVHHLGALAVAAPGHVDRGVWQPVGPIVAIAPTVHRPPHPAASAPAAEPVVTRATTVSVRRPAPASSSPRRSRSAPGPSADHDASPPAADHGPKPDHGRKADRAAKADHAPKPDHGRKADRAAKADHAPKPDHAPKANDGHRHDGHGPSAHRGHGSHGHGNDPRGGHGRGNGADG